MNMNWIQYEYRTTAPNKLFWIGSISVTIGVLYVRFGHGCSKSNSNKVMWKDTGYLHTIEHGTIGPNPKPSIPSYQARVVKKEKLATFTPMMLHFSYKIIMITSVLEKCYRFIGRIL